MRILFVTPMVPSVTGGSATRTYNLIKQLAANRQEVSVLSLVQPFELNLLPALEPYCRRIELIPFEGYVPLGKWRNRLAGWWRLFLDPRPQYARTYPVETMFKPLARLIREVEFDLVHFANLFVAELLPGTSGLPAVLDEDNAEFEIARRRQAIASNPVHRLRDYLAWKKLRKFETRWIQEFPVCLAVSITDAGILGTMAGDSELHVVPNGVDTTYFTPSSSAVPDRNRHIVFAGTMHYHPNVDGALLFCKEVWPLVRQALPDTTLSIVGARPVAEVMALNNLPGVTVTGFVEDIRPYFWEAAASVVPLRIGGGTRLKILESLAAGCPVVSTTLGAEGLDLEPGFDLLLADDPEEFAACILQLLNDGARRDRLASHGQQTVQSLYDWSVIADRLEHAYQRALEKHRC